jgi:hypothetical protein
MAFNLSLLNQWIEERKGNIIYYPIELDGSIDFLDKVTNVSGQLTKLPVIDTDVTATTNPCSITPTGETKLDQFSITTQPFKIRLEYCLHDLQQYFATQWLPQDTEFPKEFDALDGILEETLLKVALKQSRQVWLSDTGVAAFPNDFKSFNGLIKQIQANIPASNQTTLPSGQTITILNAISVMDSIIDKLPPIDGKELVMFVPSDVVKKLMLALRNANYFHYTADPERTGDGKLKPFTYPGSEVLIVPTSALNSNAVPGQPLSKKQCIYATYKGNLTIAYNISQDGRRLFYSEYHDRVVIEYKYFIGAGVKRFDLISEFHLTP